MNAVTACRFSPALLSATLALAVALFAAGCDSSSDGSEEDNARPSASFEVTTESPAAGGEVTFDASGSSDSDGEIQIYEWDFDSDGETDETGARATHVFGEAGSQPVQLTVEDAEGATDSATESVEVAESQTMPTARFEVTTGSPVAGAEVAFDASGSSTPEGQIQLYEWDFDGDGETDAEGETATHVFEETGSKSIELTVENGEGETGTSTDSVEVGENPNVPMASFAYGPNHPLVGEEEVTFDASTSESPAGRDLAYAWDFNGDGETDAESETAEHVFEEGGEQPVRLTVTDEEGLSETTERAVAVNRPPSAEFSLTDEAKMILGPVEAEVTSTSDPDGDAVDFQWAIEGDTTAISDSSFIGGTFGEPGMKSFTLTVTDEHGASTSAGKSVTITELAQGAPYADRVADFVKFTTYRKKISKITEKATWGSTFAVNFSERGNASQGNAAPATLIALDRAFALIEYYTGIPVEYTEDAGERNLGIYVTTRERVEELVGGSALGYASLSGDGKGNIGGGQIYLSQDGTLTSEGWTEKQAAVAHRRTVYHEVFHIMGLNHPNEWPASDAFSGSIMDTDYDDGVTKGTEEGLPAEIDLLGLEALYRPEIETDMNRINAAEIIRGLGGNESASVPAAVGSAEVNGLEELVGEGREDKARGFSLDE